MTYTYLHQKTLNNLYEEFRKEARHYTHLGNLFAPKEEMISSLERYQRIGDIIERLEMDKMKRFHQFERDLESRFGGTD